jgi:hypothetical protein
MSPFVSQGSSGTSTGSRAIFYDYGTIVFSILWLKEKYPTGVTVSDNGTSSTSITFYPQTRGSINNGGWSMNANVVAEYLGTNYNYITLYYNNVPFSSGGTTGNTTSMFSSFNCEVKNTSAVSNVPGSGNEMSVWLVPNQTSPT